MMPLVAAMIAAMLTWLVVSRNSSLRARLTSMSSAANTNGSRQTDLHASHTQSVAGLFGGFRSSRSSHPDDDGMGLGVWLAGAVAALRSGAAFDDVCIGARGPSPQSHHSLRFQRSQLAHSSHRVTQAHQPMRIRDSMGRMQPHLLRAMLAQHCSVADSDQQLTLVAQGLLAAHMLSAQLGCRAAVCCEAVRLAHARMRLQADLTANAFAMPRSTVRVLSVLPALTLLLGELLGAHPIAFLCGSVLGWVCLCVGALCWGVGLWWMRMLLERVAA
ncbi:hypothetical protein [Bifidobacterium gallicum]|uniref:Flp pilus assembly protein n=1 Tax=Bifidobacterium gallicum DSM 20093 = LMG 11596 TaxID=561180 RepID=D1NVX9_9BIFI|nr:hypothetical protein [Bifidobacterium gallicum]EFA22265.1 hypothetical protein BIFGAL_04023 [Bifidobacterium gallicum DSM 20093 = LMG 11596]KFI59998.1 Flp pilus assembly protein [Bifidobacterium gallicum DSM 20093 = LMG 11596]